MTRKIAVVPTTLDEKLFGDHVGTVDNYIDLKLDDTGSFFGPKAQKYLYPPLRARVTELVEAKRRGTLNCYWVLEGDVCRAGQYTLAGALKYMKADYVLVHVD